MKRITSLLLLIIVIICIPCISYAEPPEKCNSCNETDCFSSEPDCTLDVPIKATCTEPGRDCYICKKCGVHNYVSIPPLGHDLEETIITQPSYSEPGKKVTACKRTGCTESKTEDIPALELQSVSIAPGALTIKEGESSTWSATVYPEAQDAPEVTWSSSDSTVATVVVDGVVTGVKEGTATITASAGGKSDSRTVTIVKADTPVGDKYTITTGVYVINAGSGAGSNPGTVIGGGEYEPGERASLTVVENPSYTFMGWEVDGESKGSKQPLELEVTKNIHVIARFLKNGPISYKVKYCPDSYTIETDSPEDTKTENESLQLRGVTYHRTGYVQVGWLSSTDGNSYGLDSMYNLNSNITLYPKWAVAGEHTLTVYYNADCGNIKTGETLVKNGGTFKIKDDGSATFHFTAIPDYYTGSVVLNGVKQNFKDDTFTVSGRGADQTLKVTFYSRFGNPATGDNSNLLLWSCLFGLSAAAVATGMILKKKSKT